MSKQFHELSESEAWNMLVSAGVRTMNAAGMQPIRMAGRGRSNVWEVRDKGKVKKAAIRTTKDRWIAFPPLNGGKNWKTLDDVDIVIVVAVDDETHPQGLEVYQFDADEVRERFDRAYDARTTSGHTIKDNFGMWVGLDEDNRGLPASVGAGIAQKHAPIAKYSFNDLIAETDPPIGGEVDGDDNASERGEAAPQLHSIADVMNWARQRIATISGVRPEAVRLDCRIEA